MNATHLFFLGLFAIPLASSGMNQGMYYWRKDLESVKLCELLKTAYEYDLPLENLRSKMYTVSRENIDAKGNCISQTALSHALRQNYPEEFAEFLASKGIIDPVCTPIICMITSKKQQVKQ